MGCIHYGQIGDGLFFVGSTIFLFDYVLTFPDEVKFLLSSRQSSKLGTGLFVICRYCTLGMVVLVLTPARNLNAIADSIRTILVLTSVIASEMILALRTWAIWGRNRKILYPLAAVAVGGITTAAIIIGKSVATNQVHPLIIPELAHLCSTTWSDIRFAFIVPYVLTISYEILTLALSLYRITKWRQSMPESIRAPLLDILWRDGVMYFTFMLLLNFMNIGLVLQSQAPQLRSSGANLQAVLHSVTACRMVLHLAMSNNPRDITNSALSIYADASDVRFTTQIVTYETVERQPASRGE
ncbi:hypothetical protein PM082_019085 [Marasmius tenuissimus]|nr:hypothetical protein PM082_019085 [Marasmius tenuissimus]